MVVSGGVVRPAFQAVVKAVWSSRVRRMVRVASRRVSFSDGIEGVPTSVSFSRVWRGGAQRLDGRVR